MNKNRKWWITFGLTGLLAIGLTTNFTFNKVDVQIHDTYYEVPSFVIILIVVIVLGLLKGLFDVIDKVMQWNNIVTITVLVLNALFMLALLWAMVLSIRKLVTVKQWYPDLNISSYLGAFVVLCVIFLLQISFHIRNVKKSKAILFQKHE